MHVTNKLIRNMHVTNKLILAGKLRVHKNLSLLHPARSSSSASASKQLEMDCNKEQKNQLYMESHDWEEISHRSAGDQHEPSRI